MHTHEGERAKCVYCHAPADSEEDWFPRWMGKYKGIGLLKDRLCEKCNNALGQDLDQVMSRQSGEALNRWRFQIPGRKKKPLANPFLYKAQEGPPMVLVADEVDRHDFAPLRFLDEKGRAPCLRQIVILNSAGKKIPIALEERFTASWLRKAVAIRDLVGAPVTDIFWDAPDDEAFRLPKFVQVSIGDAIPGFQTDVAAERVRMHALDNRGEQREGSASLSVIFSPVYRRALAKIAFHYLLMFDRNITGLEPEFDSVKRFIREGSGNRDDFAVYHSREFVVERRDAKKTMGPRHYLYAESDRKNQLNVYLRLFSRCDPFSMPPMRVTLGKDPFVRRLHRAHVITVLSPRKSGFDGELIQLRTGRFYGSDVAFDMRTL
ncbi:MAG: hypothetical protein ABI672_18340 [Vicinamibacteria bacterium]